MSIQLSINKASFCLFLITWDKTTGFPVKWLYCSVELYMKIHRSPYKWARIFFAARRGWRPCAICRFHTFLMFMIILATLLGVQDLRWNPGTLHWKRCLNHWAPREVPPRLSWLRIWAVLGPHFCVVWEGTGVWVPSGSWQWEGSAREPGKEKGFVPQPIKLDSLSLGGAWNVWSQKGVSGWL